MQKYLPIGVIVSILVAAFNAVYSAGVLSSSVTDNAEDISDYKEIVKQVPVLANEVRHNTQLMEANKVLLDDHSDRLEDLKDGQHEIKVLMQSIKNQ